MQLKRFLIAVIVMTAMLSTYAFTLKVPRLSGSPFADGEDTTDITVSALAQQNLREVRLELTFNATLSNNVQIALGRDDRPQDDLLAAEESAFILGWDSGVWFIRPSGLKEHLVFTPPNADTAQVRTLKLSIFVKVDGTSQVVRFADDNGSFIFPNLPLAPPPPCFHPASWDILRVTTRGADIADEDVQVRFLPGGIIIMLK